MRTKVGKGLSKNRRDNDGTGRSLPPAASDHVVALMTRRADDGTAIIAN